MLQCHRVKLFTDGCLGAETAAMSADYISPLNRCDSHDAKKTGSQETRYVESPDAFSLPLSSQPTPPITLSPSGRRTSDAAC